AAVVFVRDPGPALGLQVLAALQAASYLLCAVIVVILHLAANRRRWSARETSTEGWLTWTSGGAALALVVAVVGVTAAALAWRLQTYGLP
ncbi:MAG: hypothetical protein M3137_07690, partial [Actinomycetota bacterium]|nr:hypothetical protein [Actinomycetota bacterium]